jgi:hypothetical protein
MTSRPLFCPFPGAKARTIDAEDARATERWLCAFCLSRIGLRTTSNRGCDLEDGRLTEWHSVWTRACDRCCEGFEASVYRRVSLVATRNGRKRPKPWETYLHFGEGVEDALGEQYQEVLALMIDSVLVHWIAVATGRAKGLVCSRQLNECAERRRKNRALMA